MDRLEVARRWLDAKGSRSKAVLDAVAEVISDAIVTPSATGKVAVLEAIRGAKGAYLFSTGTWGPLEDDGDVITARCVFAEDAPYYGATVTLRIDEAGLITEASTRTHGPPPGAFDDVANRVWGPRVGLHDLPAHLSEHHGIEVTDITRLDNGVFKVERTDGDPWVARVFPADRPVESVQGDAEVLHFLAANDFPAERCARENAVTTLAGQGVLVTAFIPGKQAGQSAATWKALADLLGRLHAMPGGSDTVRRESGALHLYTVGGSIKEELARAAESMDSMAEQASKTPFASDFMLVRKQLDVADDFSDLPRGLVHTDFHQRNTIAATDGRLVPVDWALSGHGPRVVSLGTFMLGVGAGGKLNAARLKTIIGAYGRHITLEQEEIDRLADAMLHRHLIFEAYGQCMGVATKQKTWGMGAWLNEREMCARIAEATRELLAT